MWFSLHLLIWNNELYQGARGLTLPFSLKALNVFLRNNSFKLNERRINKSTGSCSFCFCFFLFLLFARIAEQLSSYPVYPESTLGGPHVLWYRSNVRQDSQTLFIPTGITLEPCASFQTIWFFFIVKYRGICLQWVYFWNNTSYLHVLPSNSCSSSPPSSTEDLSPFFYFSHIIIYFPSLSSHI